MRALLVPLIVAGCLPGYREGRDGPRDELVVAATLDGDTLSLTTEWSLRGERERGRRLTIALSDGTCLLVGDEEDFAGAPSLPLSPIEHDLVAGPHAVLHPLDDALELVFDDGRPRTRHGFAPDTRVRWVVDTTLVLVEKHRLVDLESGRSILVDGPDWAKRFAIAQNRLFAVQDGHLAAYDLHLRELAAPAPALTLYDVGGAFGVAHVWQHALGDDIGFTHVRGARAVALTGFRGAAATASLAAWSSVGPGTALSFAENSFYAQIDGEPFELVEGELARIPAALGGLVTADAGMIVLANPDDRAVWVSVAGGALRPYSFNRCAYAGH